jgi:alpha-ketoglutarate-dependent taurine dioxygenase
MSSVQFSGGNRKAVRLSADELVRRSHLDGCDRLPLVLEPNLADLDLVDYAANNRDAIAELLSRYGAILCRGFRLETAEQFQRLIAAVSAGALEYTERSSPRSRVTGNIYTSTDYPPEQPIFLHNEQSYNWIFPRQIAFCCLVPAAAGGATPIADCRRVYERIPGAIREKFERLGYTYVRNFGGGLGLSWQEAFQTADPREVEAYCARQHITAQWRPAAGAAASGPRLRTRQVRPAVAVHPRTGQRTWFNHLTFFHVSTLPPAMRAMISELGDEELPNNTYYGDGSAIEPEVLDALRAIYAEETVTFPWRQGDALLLDNMLTAHGRQAYQGARKVVAGMAEPVSWEEVRVEPVPG